MRWTMLAILGLALVGLVVFALIRGRIVQTPGAADDKAIEGEFIDHLRLEFPSLTIERPSQGEIRLKASNGESVALALDNAIGDVRGLRPEERKAAFERFTAPVRDWVERRSRGLVGKEDRVFPRLVHAEFVESMLGADPIVRAVGSTSLRICFVVSIDGQAQFLTKQDLVELGLSEDQLAQRAMINARSLFSREELEAILSRPGRLSIIDGGDSYNAARMLVMKEMLKPGRVLGAAVPDRDTLIVVADPDEAAWSKLEEAARKPASSRAILDRPLKITSDGIAVH